MTEIDEELGGTIRALGAGPAAHDLYKDLLQPAAKETGQNLLVVAKAVTLAFSPIKATVFGLENIKDWIQDKLIERLANTKPNDISAPRLSVAGPTLLGLNFTRDEEELREMYVNLLASSMDKTSEEDAHPAFAEIIRQMTSREAKILRLIYETFPTARTGFEESSDGSTRKGESSWKTMQRIGSKAGINDREKSFVCFENLERLRILETYRASSSKLVRAGYDERQEWDDHIINIDTYEMFVSGFGKRFINTCVRRKDENAWPELKD